MALPGTLLQVRLLAHGFLDAEVHPEVAGGVVGALWLAARHPAAEVRSHPWWPVRNEHQSTTGCLTTPRSHLGLDVKMRAPRNAWCRCGGGRRISRWLPTILMCWSASKRCARWAIAALLHSEAAPANRPACEALVSAALAFEHRQRRRVGRAGGAAAGAAAGGGGAARAGAASVGGSVLHRLASVLPKALLGGSVASVSDLLQRLPELPVVRRGALSLLRESIMIVRNLPWRS